MELLQQTIDRLASPWVLYSGVLVFLVVASRTRFLLTRWGGMLLAALTAAVLGVSLVDVSFRGLVLDPARLPALVWLLLSLAFFWLALHRARYAETEQDPELQDAAGGGSSGDANVVVVAGLALMACAVFFDAPLGEPAGAPQGSDPWFLSGFQELRFYFDPWMAAFGLPALFLVALLALPYLDPPNESETTAAREPRRLMAFVAAGLLLVLLPVLVATFLRGPQWNAFGPFEIRDAAMPPPAPAAPLSEVFWSRWLGMSAPPASWALRELPGAWFLAVYFVFLPWWLARWSATRKVLGRYLEAVGPWRYRLALVLALALTLVPLKMFGRWLFGVGHWLSLPELSLAF